MACGGASVSLFRVTYQSAFEIVDLKSEEDWTGRDD